MSDTPVHFFDIDSKLKGMTQLTCMHAFKHTHSQCLTALFISQGLRDLGLPTRTSFCSLKLVYFNDLTIVEFNSLKVRISLNYKQIPYTETFVSYPDIKPLWSPWAIQTTPRNLIMVKHALPFITPTH